MATGTSLSAQTWNVATKVVASDRKYLAYYGNAVAISGNYAVVGAMNERESSNNSSSITNAGAIYILEKSGTAWNELKKITAPYREEYENFGNSVAINGDYIIVGAPGDSQDENEDNTIRSTGSAYIYKREPETGNWNLVKKITSPTRRQDAYFGHSVAISGDNVVVGAYYDSYNGSVEARGTGTAFIFNKNKGGQDQWQLVTQLTPSTWSDFDNFGSSVSISGDYAIVGAQQHSPGDITTEAAGAAYIFKKNYGGNDAWGEVKKIEAPFRSQGDYFGTSVSIDNGFAIVGAPNHAEDSFGQNPVSNAGAAYIFSKDNGGADFWGLQNKIAATYRSTNDQFGKAVSIHGDYAVVSSVYDDEDETEQNYIENSGSAYIYGLKRTQNNWEFRQKIVAPVRASSSNFGISAAIHERNVIIGANLEFTDNQNQNQMLYPGAAYIFENTSTALPVVLANFSVTEVEKTSVLKWNTTSEINADHFEIQRSPDGKTWHPISTISASGNSSKLIDYVFVDTNPLNGENLYRIKMVDWDQKFSFSSLRSVLITKPQNDFYVYPNPLLQEAFILLKNNLEIQQLSIINLNGKEIQRITTPGSKITVGSLASGTYIIRVQYKGRLDTDSSVFVKR